MFASITDFHDGVHDYLSNFYLAPIVVWGVGFPSTEHAYQWAKTNDAREKEYILWRNVKLNNPLSAPNGIHTTCYTSKKRGTEVTLRADWEQVKYDIMVEVCRAKFEQHPDLAEKLGIAWCVGSISTAKPWFRIFLKDGRTVSVKRTEFALRIRVRRDDEQIGGDIEMAINAFPAGLSKVVAELV
jgi:predicted NAD-dependent protein-ADP-ribosyltransferase YbiA (DUF1768 family)